MNRTMFTQLAYSKTEATEEPVGLVVNILGDEDAGIEDQVFYVSRDEAEDLIYMIANGLDIDLEEVAS